MEHIEAGFKERGISKMLKVLTVTTDLEQTRPLIQSLEKNGFDFEVIQTVWRGFGTKLIEVYNYLKENPEVDRFIFCDAFDVVCLGTQNEFEEKLGEWSDKIVLSAEKNCWPQPDLERWYEPIDKEKWSFVNSGLYYSPTDKFIELMDRHMPEPSADDQLYMTTMFLFESNDMILDRECKLFQSYSFIKEGEFSYSNGRLHNEITNESAIWVHGNGKTDMTKVRELL